MSKNITIEEGEKTKKFGSVSRLRTDKVGGGTCDWFPEDEMEDTTITANGTYRAVDRGLCAFGEVEVAVPASGGGDFTELYAIDDGTYRARSEGYDGYNRVVVDCDTISGVMDDGNDYIIQMEEDPTTGELSFPVDQGGTIEVTKIPSAIQIDTLPSKLEYRTGETVYLTGGVVKTYDGEGNLYTDSTYTDGVIPNSELEVAPLTVSYQAAVDAGGEIVEEGTPKYTELSGTHTLPMTASGNRSTLYLNLGSNVVRAVGLTSSASTNYFVLVSETPVSGAKWGMNYPDEWTLTFNQYTIDGRTCYVHSDIGFLVDGFEYVQVSPWGLTEYKCALYGYRYTYGSLNGEPTYIKLTGQHTFQTESSGGYSYTMRFNFGNNEVRGVDLITSTSYPVLVFVSDEPVSGATWDGSLPMNFEAFTVSGATYYCWAFKDRRIDDFAYGRVSDSSLSDYQIKNYGVQFTFGSSAVGPSKFGVKQTEEVTWINPYNKKPLKDSYEIVILKPEDDSNGGSHSSGGLHF